jgi:hypothetical protein
VLALLPLLHSQRSNKKQVSTGITVRNKAELLFLLGKATFGTYCIYIYVANKFQAMHVVLTVSIKGKDDPFLVR